MEENRVALEEQLKRKEVAKRRTFWFLVVFNLVLVAYIFIQIVMIITAK